MSRERGGRFARGTLMLSHVCSIHASMHFLETARDAGRLADGNPIRMEAWKAERPPGSEPEPEQAVDVPLVYSDLTYTSTGHCEARVSLNCSPLRIGVPSACREMAMGARPSRSVLQSLDSRREPGVRPQKKKVPCDGLCAVEKCTYPFG